MINKLSPLPNFLISRYKNWKSSTYLKNQKKFSKLASQGQNPTCMIISCCDSRVHATSLFSADEGEFFIHRNIANLVPPFLPHGNNYGTSAVIEYALNELKIKHIIILGHTGCGGIETSYNFHKTGIKKDYVFIYKWLKIISPALKNILKNESKNSQLRKLEEESIKNSIKNLFTYPNIKKEVKNENLFVHGLIHDIGSGSLKYLNPINKKFEAL